MKCTIRLKGGAGSGFFGHSGRLGFIGGSMAPDKGFGGGGGDTPTKRIRAKLILPQEAFDRLLDASPADIKYAAKHRDIDTMKTLLASANLSSDKRKANAELLRSLIGETSQPVKPAATTTSPSLLDATDKFNAAKAASTAANDNVQRVREQFGAGSAEERAARDALQTANIKYNDARADLIEAGGNPKTVKPTVIEQPKAVNTDTKIVAPLSRKEFYELEEGMKRGRIKEFYKGKFVKRVNDNSRFRNNYHVYEFTTEDGIKYTVDGSYMSSYQTSGRLRIPSGTSSSVRLTLSRIPVTEPGKIPNTDGIRLLSMTRRGEGSQVGEAIHKQQAKIKKYANDVFGIPDLEFNF